MADCLGKGEANSQFWAAPMHRQGCLLPPDGCLPLAAGFTTGFTTVSCRRCTTSFRPDQWRSVSSSKLFQ